VDELVLVSQADAEDMVRRLAREEGLFAGISAAGACWVALQMAQRVENATIVFIVCDRGDRYLSTGVFPHEPSPRRAFLPAVRPAPLAPSRAGRRRRRQDRCAARPAAGRTGTTRRRCWPPSSSAPTARPHAAGAQCRLAGRMFALITGFMEAGETPQEGITREVAEETALDVLSLS
jgi:hypothetical protein